MSAVLVDSNVLLDIVSEDPRWFDWSSRVLEQAGDRSRLVVNPVIFAEVSVRFTRIEDLDEALSTFDREPIPFAAAFLAGKCFLHYRKSGGEKRSPLPDFFIGAHAATSGYRLMTRDTRRYRAYFPKLSLISPD